MVVDCESVNGTFVPGRPNFAQGNGGGGGGEARTMNVQFFVGVCCLFRGGVLPKRVYYVLFFCF